MQASVNKVSRVVMQYGEFIGERADSDIVELSKGQATALETVIATPNGGVKMNVDGSFTALAVPAPTPDPNAADKTTLATIQAKTWATVTALEKDEALRILTKLRG